jgi:DNA-binding MarR family transcriptional regulator
MNPADNPFTGAARACVLYSLHRAVRAADQVYDAAFRKVGLRSTQVFLLNAIEARAPVTLGDLARGIVVDRTTLTRNIQPLLKAGLVSVRAGQDRRVREISITAAGRRRVRQAYPLWRQSQEFLAGRLGAAAVADLLGHLRGIVAITRER